MTTYSLMDGVAGRPGNGPASPTAYSGNFLAGTMFSVAGQVMWFDSYRLWVPPGGDTVARKFALWNRFSTSGQQVVTGSTVTSGTLTAGQWNTVNLATPIQIAPGGLYVASTGWLASAGFPDTQNQFGSGQPFAGGIVNGPVTGWSDLGGSNEFPAASLNYGLDQGLFSVAGTDPTVNMPNGGSNSANFWVDFIVNDTAPGGYAGSYRLWPNKVDLGNYNLDTANGFTLGLEFNLAKASALNAVWFYSPAGVTVLPTECAIYDVTSQAIVSGTHNVAPSWTLPGGGAAAAGGGWMFAPMPGSVQLAAGTNYKVVVFQGANTIWNAAVAAYWSTGFGANGLISGPINAPSDAASTTPGQASYHQAASISYPDTHAGPFDYGVDLEVTPSTGSPHTATATLMVVPSLAASRVRGRSRTAALTVAPAPSATRARGHSRTAALPVTPALSATRTRGHSRTAALTVVPALAVARARGHVRVAALDVAPAFTTARMAAHVRTAALGVTPHLTAVPHKASTVRPALFSTGRAMLPWTAGRARNT